MYHSYYGLQSDPFRLSPDHAFCLRHVSFIKARAYMQYALHRAEGFVMITGAPGTGKTTLIDDLLAEAKEGELSVGRLVSVQLGADDVLRLVAYAFSIPADGLDKSELLHRLGKEFSRLFRQRRRPLLIVDEAQGLQQQALEELRLLTNLSLEGRPLLQIFLIGQEELAGIVTAPGLEQLNQRIVASCRMEALKPDEFVAYILHRLRVSGWRGNPAFAPGIFPDLFRCSQGIPRRINHICSRLLLHGALEGKNRLDKWDLEVVVAELRDEHYLTKTGSSIFELDRFNAGDMETLAEYALAKSNTPEPESRPAPLTGEGGAESPSKNCDPPQLCAEQIVEPGGTRVEVMESPKAGSIAAKETAAEVEPGDVSPGDGANKHLDAARLAPLWGAGAAALLCLLLTLLVLLSAPDYQFRRLSGHAVWEGVGVTAMRARIFRITEGHWPIRGRIEAVAEPVNVEQALLAMEPASVKLIKEESGNVTTQPVTATMSLDRRPEVKSALGLK